MIALGGGIGYSGSPTCVAGYTCTYSNNYYSQCLPSTGAGTTTASHTTAAPTSTGTGAVTTVAASGNPFSGVALYANPYYASEISTSAIPSLSGAQATAAAAVANVPTFFWL